MRKFSQIGIRELTSYGIVVIVCFIRKNEVPTEMLDFRTGFAKKFSWSPKDNIDGIAGICITPMYISAETTM